MKYFRKQNTASASVVDGKLILSFPEALNPVVWQMDLGEAKSSALEVVENGKDGGHKLTLTTHKGESIDIAPFEQREHAVDGLKMIAKALENAHGQIRPAPSGATNDTYSHHGAPRKRKWVTIALSLVGLFVLLNIWAAMTGQTDGNQYNATTTASDQNSAASSANDAGVPISADDFLRGR